MQIIQQVPVIVGVFKSCFGFLFFSYCLNTALHPTANLLVVVCSYPGGGGSAKCTEDCNNNSVRVAWRFGINQAMMGHDSVNPLCRLE